MAGNSKAELLSWLRAEDRLMGYDLIFALDKNKTDTLLTQEYIRRFNSNAYFPPISGETTPDNGYQVYMYGFLLDHPRLSFDNADITGSRASLRMRIVAGNQLDLKQAGAHWYPQRIDRIGPLAGPELHLRLELSRVPVYVDDGGEIILDLRDSDDFLLTFSKSNRIRQIGGAFFREKFRALPDEQRVWSLGRIAQGNDQLLQPDSFVLRTQRNPAVELSPMMEGDAADVDGAVLGLVKMVGNQRDLATPGEGFKYLIPKTDEHFSAAIMHQSVQGLMASIFKVLERAGLQNTQLRMTYQPQSALINFMGEFVFKGIPGRRVSVLESHPALPPYVGTYDAYASGSIDALTLPVENFQGTLEIGRDKVRLRIPFKFVLPVRLEEFYEYSHFEAWYNVPVTLRWPMEGIVDLTWEMGDSVMMVLTDRTIEFKTTDVHEDFDWAPGGSGDLWEKGLAARVALAATIGKVAVGLCNTWAYEQWATTLIMNLAVSMDLKDIYSDIIRMNFGETVIPHEHHWVWSIATFGHVNPSLTTFSVNPLEDAVTTGSQLQFSTVPAQPRLTWSVEAAESSLDDPGHFHSDVSGLYLAPAASGMEGEFTRVRVTATAPNGFSSSALITVVKQALALSPLLEVCQVGDEGVPLKAGQVGDGELHWRILGARAHGRLRSDSGPNNSYIPGDNIAGQSFLLEEIEVSNSLTLERQTMCVVTQMTAMRPSDVLVEQQDAVLRRVWLSISAGGQVGISELTVVHGPGQIATDSSGKPYYQAPAASAAHFCVIRAYWEPMPGFPFAFEGFIVLPLPLQAHAAAYQTLEQAAQSISGDR